MDITKEKANITEGTSWERVIFVGYIAILFAAASIRDFFVIPFVTHHLIGITAAFVEPLYKLLFWIAPTILYIKYVIKANPLTYLKLTVNVRKGIGGGVLIGVLLFLLFVLPAALLHGKLPRFALSFDDWLNSFLLVGILEEIPFRGLVFQRLQSLLGFWKATLVSSLLFAMVHVPLWLSRGEVLLPNDLPSLFTVFLVGVGLCYLFKRTGSLWSCILVHSVYDLTTFR
jgi:uncharacterized protein